MKYSRNRVSKIKDKKRSSRKIQLLKRFKAKGGIKSTNKKKKCGNLKYKTLKYLKRSIYYIKRMTIIHDIFVGDSITTERICEIKNIMYTVDKYNTYRSGYREDTENTIVNEKVELSVY